MADDIIDPADGLVRICADRCGTCIYRPGNLMHLAPGRVKEMTEEAARREGHIVCHQTLEEYGKGLPGAVCRGYEQHPLGAERSLALRWAGWLGRAAWLDTETGELTEAPYPSAQTDTRPPQ